MTTLRQQLGEAAGRIDLIVSKLSRIEHGDARSEVREARSALRAEVARLEVLRAHLAERVMIPIVTDRLHGFIPARSYDEVSRSAQGRRTGLDPRQGRGCTAG
jgi:hypothetical protein